ncbi:MAG: PqqD family protein [Porphyromonas sp.]|nr:PqqD family protein [Porphyromonas sp.]
MRIKDTLTLRKIADEYIMITEQGNSVDYTTAIALNDTAVFLIQSTEGKEFTAEDWVQLLTENYEVDEEIARKDVDSLIASLHEIGIIA